MNPGCGKAAKKGGCNGGWNQQVSFELRLKGLSLFKQENRHRTNTCSVCAMDVAFLKTLMRFTIIVLFLFCSSFNDTFAQSAKSSFHPEGYGKLYNREHVYFISINTENSPEAFYKELNRRFDSPVVRGGYTIYKGDKERWTMESVVIRIEEAIQTELDQKQSNTLFIYVETSSHKDLLNPKCSAHKNVRAYFHALYDETISNIANH